MSPQSVYTEYGSWKPEGHSLRVEFAMPVMEEICALSVDGMFRFRHGGVEVGGVLFGEADQEVVRVLGFRPLECEHAFGPRFVLSERDRARLRELLYAPKTEADLAGLEPVGWYHSHTRSEVALSPRDLEVYDSYFPQRWQVALVLRPEHYEEVRAGFFFREADGGIRVESSYAEFSIRPNRGRMRAAEEAEEAEEEAVPAASAAEAEPVTAAPAVTVKVAEKGPEAPDRPAPGSLRPSEPSLPQFAQVQPQRSYRMLWRVLVLMLALVGVGGGVFGVVRYYRQAPQPLGLWVADMGGQLLIEWDRGAQPIRDATGGMLEIQDGTDRVAHKIDGDRLREGSIDYVRHAEIVDVRLRVEGGGNSGEEFLRFIGPPVRRNAGAEADLTKQRDEMKAEVDRLNQVVADKDAQITRLRAALRAVIQGRRAPAPAAQPSRD